MEQLTKEQAILFSNFVEWKHWTSEEIVRFQLFQDKLCMDFLHFHKATEEVLERDVFVHEFSNPDNLIKEYLGAKEPPTLDEIINLIPEDKRLIIKL